MGQAREDIKTCRGVLRAEGKHEKLSISQGSSVPGTQETLVLYASRLLARVVYSNERVRMRFARDETVAVLRACLVIDPRIIF